MYKLNKLNIHVKQPFGMSIFQPNGKFEQVNGIGCDILELLTSPKNFEELLRILLSFYDVGKDLLFKDLKSFINNCEKRKIIIKSNYFDTSEIKIYGNSINTTITQADIELTYRCNYRCNYCYVDKRDDSIIRFDEWKQIIINLVDRGVLQVSLTGGDPLLHPDFPQIIQLLNSYSVKVQVFTTGYKVPENNLKALLNADINFVHVSLDSLNKERNDENRIAIDGSSATENTLEFIKILKKHNINIVLGSLIKPDYLKEDLYDISKFAIENNIKVRFGGIVKRSIEKNNQYDKDILPPKKYSLIEETLNSFKFTEDFYESEITDGVCDDYFPCKFLSGFIAISPLGKIKPCLESKEYFKKHILDFEDMHCDIRDFRVLNNTKLYKYISNIGLEFKPNPDTWCKNCMDFSECNGCSIAGYYCRMIKNKIKEDM